MLKLVNLVKDYAMKDQPTVHALKGISINFRRNEFVAILGPSGCGKTTLLNITGGLDRYTDGDLIIEGKSTKDYTDRDWDTYRNHSIGFVFQSYNLIGHQSILKNVELALTISGIKKAERRQRAMDALDQVGLAGLYHKKPNQLSGGQMQRVAIARSLVNNPEILLADEPTGALDSQTSIQVMDILKEVAKDRLVIMVTHNPELAYQYANRIIKMKDGEILDDSKPFEGETEEEHTKAREAKAEIIAAKGKGKSSMSFVTATGLSFSNLVSKLKRTILIAIAGSIGIIGVSAVLAVSTGVSSYIDNMQNDMLSSYPVTISEASVDYTSLLAGLSSWDEKVIAETDLTDKVAVDSMITYLMDKYQDITSIKTNDINDELLQFIKDAPEELVSSLDFDYGIDPTNNLFTEWTRYSSDKGDSSKKKMASLNGLTQMYISELKTVDGFSEYAQYVTLFTKFMKQMNSSENYILSQYDLIAGSKFATEPDELMLVVDSDQTLTDILLAQLGFFTETEFLNIARRAIEENKENPDEEKIAGMEYPQSFTYDQILGHEMVYYPHDSIYNYVTKKVKSLSVRFLVPSEYISTFGDTAAFNLTLNETTGLFEGAISVKGYNIDASFSQIAPGDGIHQETGLWQANIMGLPIMLNLVNDGTTTTAYLPVDVDPETGNPIYINAKYTCGEVDKNGYRYSTVADTNALVNGTKMKIVGILKPKEGLNFGCLDRGLYFTQSFTQKYIQDSWTSEIISDSQHGLLNYINGETDDIGEFMAYTTFEYSSFRYDKNVGILVEGELPCLNGAASGVATLLSDTSSYNNVQKAAQYVRSLSGLAIKQRIEHDDVNNIDKYVFYFDDLPYNISIYPKDFDAKDKLLAYFDKWNSDGVITLSNGTVLQPGVENRAELTYTDTIGMIITVIDSLITGITIALVAFTSLSLVVSCFMIAVITYISTMERVKEIGIIRSLGGRKKDVSRLFIAECLIIGIASGVIGIGITAILVAILNAIVASLGVFNIAILSPTIIIVMIALSIVLNVLSGLIPSMKASHQDPVIALRTE